MNIRAVLLLMISLVFWQFLAGCSRPPSPPSPTPAPVTATNVIGSVLFSPALPFIPSDLAISISGTSSSSVALSSCSLSTQNSTCLYKFNSVTTGTAYTFTINTTPPGYNCTPLTMSSELTISNSIIPTVVCSTTNVAGTVTFSPTSTSTTPVTLLLLDNGTYTSGSTVLPSTPGTQLFTFSAVSYYAPGYSVTVSSLPPGYVCTSPNTQSAITDNNVYVRVNCGLINTYNVSGFITFLPSLTATRASVMNLSLVSNGNAEAFRGVTNSVINSGRTGPQSYSFTAVTYYTGGYTFSITNPPLGYSCHRSSGVAGLVIDSVIANVTNLNINCTRTPMSVTVSNTASAGSGTIVSFSDNFSANVVSVSAGASIPLESDISSLVIAATPYVVSFTGPAGYQCTASTPGSAVSGAVSPAIPSAAGTVTWNSVVAGNTYAVSVSCEHLPTPVTVINSSTNPSATPITFSDTRGISTTNSGTLQGFASPGSYTVNYSCSSGYTPAATANPIVNPVYSSNTGSVTWDIIAGRSYAVSVSCNQDTTSVSVTNSSANAMLTPVTFSHLSVVSLPQNTSAILVLDNYASVGSYTVGFSCPAGYTPDATANPSVTPAYSSNQGTVTWTIIAGQSYTLRVGCNQNTTSVTVTNNSTNGAVVSVYDNVNSSFSSVSQKVLTDSTPFVIETLLTPGAAYTLNFACPLGHSVAATTNLGGSPVISSGSNTGYVSLSITAGQAYTVNVICTAIPITVNIILSVPAGKSLASLSASHHPTITLTPPVSSVSSTVSASLTAVGTTSVSLDYNILYIATLSLPSEMVCVAPNPSSFTTALGLPVMTISVICHDNNLRITPLTASISRNGTQQYALRDNGVIVPVTSATWSSSNTDAAGIDSNALATANLSGTASSTTISAVYNGDTATATLTIRTYNLYVTDNSGNFLSCQTCTNTNDSTACPSLGVVSSCVSAYSGSSVVIYMLAASSESQYIYATNGSANGVIYCPYNIDGSVNNNGCVQQTLVNQITGDVSRGAPNPIPGAVEGVALLAVGGVEYAYVLTYDNTSGGYLSACPISETGALSLTNCSVTRVGSGTSGFPNGSQTVPPFTRSFRQGYMVPFSLTPNGGLVYFYAGSRTSNDVTACRLVAPTGSISYQSSSCISAGGGGYMNQVHNLLFAADSSKAITATNNQNNSPTLSDLLSECNVSGADGTFSGCIYTGPSAGLNQDKQGEAAISANGSTRYLYETLNTSPKTIEVCPLDLNYLSTGACRAATASFSFGLGGPIVIVQ